MNKADQGIRASGLGLSKAGRSCSSDSQLPDRRHCQAGTGGKSPKAKLHSKFPGRRGPPTCPSLSKGSRVQATLLGCQALAEVVLGPAGCLKGAQSGRKAGSTGVAGV